MLDEAEIDTVTVSGVVWRNNATMWFLPISGITQPMIDVLRKSQQAGQIGKQVARGNWIILQNAGNPQSEK